MSELLNTAAGCKVGIGAFNAVLLEHAEGIVEGAEDAGLPVILQISENCINYHGALAPITSAALHIARSASVSVYVHLDHIKHPALIRQGVELGVDSVMIDASHMSYEENVRLTRDMADFCHGRGVSIESELGEVGGKDGAHVAGVRTNPAAAVAFVEATDVDSLAVAVGTSHAMQSRVANVDHSLIRALRDRVPVPLVLHGSSGLNDTELVASIASGMTKINISTHLNVLFTSAVRQVLDADASLVDPRKYAGPGRTAIASEVSRLLRLLAGEK